MRDECSYIEDTPSLYNLPTYQKDYNTPKRERERERERERVKIWEGFPKEKRERIFQNFSRVFSDFLVYIYFSLKNLFPSHQNLKLIV